VSASGKAGNRKKEKESKGKKGTREYVGGKQRGKGEKGRLANYCI